MPSLNGYQVLFSFFFFLSEAFHCARNMHCYCSTIYFFGALFVLISSASICDTLLPDELLKENEKICKRGKKVLLSLLSKTEAEHLLGKVRKKFL